MNEPQKPSIKRGKPSWTLIILLIFPLLGIMVAVFFALLNRPPATAEPALNRIVEQSPPRQLDWAAPDFELPDLDGNPVKLADLRGRVVFLNFWATWCPPCIRELPTLHEFMTSQGEDGALVLTVNSEESVAVINRFFAEQNIGAIPVLLDDGAVVRRAYNVSNLPTTYVIDAAGSVRYVKLGEITLADMYGYLAIIAGENDT